MTRSRLEFDKAEQGRQLGPERIGPEAVSSPQITSERFAVTMDGRPLGINRISELSRDNVAGLLIRLAAVHTAIAARVCNGFPSAQHDSNKNSAAGIDAENQALGQSGTSRSFASTLIQDRGMDHAAPGGKQRPVDGKTYLSVKETAAKIGNSQWTMYHWIESGKLDEAHGLRRFGRRRLIEWQAFQGCLERGEFNGTCGSRDLRA